jgi:hypothetical protein
MPRTCTVCAHPERAAIDAAALAGASYRDIAGQFHVSRSAVLRHKAEHLLADLVKAKQAEEVSRATDLLTMATERDKTALALLARAVGKGDLRTAVAALRVSLVSLELLARLRGELNEQATVNILVLPEYVATRSAVLRALDAYPEARLAVAEALEREEEEQANGHHQQHAG